jgi:ABC-type polysaccharide/polyol phosphate export permease
VKHVAFPRELLVLGVIGAQSVTLLIEFLILLIALIVVGNVSLLWLPCLVLLLVLLVCFTTGITLGLAAAYVYLRDLSHLWSVMIQLGFFTTPVIYHLELLPDRLRNIVSLNPMTSFVVAFRDVLYNLRWPNPAILMTITGWTVVAVCFGLYTFARLEPRFAEEL